MHEPIIKVGILSGSEISFRLNGIFSLNGNNLLQDGEYKIRVQDGQMLLKGKKQELQFRNFGILHPENQNCTFDLIDVTIGIQFHWERKEDQKFKGGLQFLIEDNKVTAINLIPLEDYLISVISSEMSATSSMELLKAHAVISRSWLMAQLEKGEKLKKSGSQYTPDTQTESERVKWYDREDHLNFDVCADDHCQRYQGITRAGTPIVEEAIDATRGLVLTYEDEICDARFSKSCGGVTEVFENVWEPIPHPYLPKIIDNDATPDNYNLDLTEESAAEAWIRNSPPAFCNTTDKHVLSQVLNDYDQETNDFYRWKVEYSQSELSNLLLSRTGIDFGEIIDLIPIERGASGRLIRLKIIGTKKTFIIGKELEIRKSLSTSHLYSSAFVVDREELKGNIPGKFILTGAGWGHGVGLCQIGAAVMGAKGYSFKEILLHYFKGASLEKKYN
ncbi:MAG: SpoIID/LytB domain-containing protein [Bacteroidota bacterium]|nr:SpoIID/LytB domain-containing protein [Bacteroidota bacterium]